MKIGPSFNGRYDGWIKNAEGIVYNVKGKITSSPQDKLIKEVALQIAPRNSEVLEDISLVNNPNTKLVTRIKDYLNIMEERIKVRLPKMDKISEFWQDTSHGVYVKGTAKDGAEYSLGFSYDKEYPVDYSW
jgi:hypothetical protein